MRSRSSWLHALALILTLAVAAHGQSTRRDAKNKNDAVSPVAEHYRPQLEAALQMVADGGDLKAAQSAAHQLFDAIITHADAKELELFRDTAFTVRVLDLLSAVPPTDQTELMKFFLAHMNFARALVFIARPEQEKADEVLAVVELLRTQRADAVDKFANLAAAICVVHDKPLKRRINENAATSADALSIFDYYTSNETHMLFGLTNVPAELLIYVVDTTSSIDEMRWALNKYAGDTQVGARFFDIEYDYDSFKKGTPKKVTVAGWNLPNILRYGGVCADQAYFACQVGKAIGVPTTYTVGASGEVAHAWVGFLQSDRQHAWWNFSTGRYEAYQGVKGVVLDPQIRRNVPDSSVALLAEFVTAPELNRFATIAMTDAAKRLVELESAPPELVAPVPAEDETNFKPVRSATKEDALDLLEAGLKNCPGYADAWFMVGQLAADGKLTLDEKKKWANMLHRLCGERYPDFYLAVVAPMIETVDDVNEQNSLWNAAFRAFAKRFDLAASVRMRQANMWRTKGERSKAGQCCEDVIERYANAGPFVLEALKLATDLLSELNQANRIPALYQKAWSLTKKPQDMAPEFSRQSNWYRVGVMYAESLASTGRAAEASQVRTTIGVP